ncbi:MAG TPA: DUF4142 domain-containing protein [Flavisolibacter sp.]|nr:DUF4142 domain-containing protein [Flavisolibacter sp.]
MKKFLYASLSVFLLLTACKKHDETINQLTATDLNFMMQASMENQSRIMLGSLAAARSTRPEVSGFAQQTVLAKQQEQQALLLLADELGMTLRDTVDTDSRMLRQRLSALQGYAFDTAYMKSQLRAAQKTMSLFQQEFNEGKHLSVRSYVNRYLEDVTNQYYKADSVFRLL